MGDPIHGHGHVVPRLDGGVARCGGPGICDRCSAELAQHVRENKEYANQILTAKSAKDCSPERAQELAEEVLTKTIRIKTLALISGLIEAQRPLLDEWTKLKATTALEGK